MKQSYHNIQGRRAGKATRDLHYRREATRYNPIGFSLSNSERSILRRIVAENRKQKVQNKPMQTRRLMRLLLLIKRLIGIK